IIENFLERLIKHCGCSRSQLDRMTYFNKVDYLFNKGIISDAENDLYGTVGFIRNRFSHDLGFHLNEIEVLYLYELCYCANVDFSDDWLFQEIKQGKVEGGYLEDAIHEICQNIIFHTDWILEENTGEFLFT